MISRPQQVPVAGLLRLAYNLLSMRIFAEIAEAGYGDLRSSHGNVFEQLTFRDGLRLSELAAGAGMTPQSMSELVDELEHKGYIERRPDPTDRRAKRIYLTDRGRANTRRGVEAAEHADAYVRALVGDELYRELRVALETIIEQWPGTGPPGPGNPG